MKMPKNKTQKNFKIDEITLVLIVALIAMIFGYLNKSDKNEALKMEAEKITDMLLDDHAISFAKNGVVDQNKLDQVQNMDYYDIKKSLKAKNDFCVHIEDENGNLILAKGPDNLDCR